MSNPIAPHLSALQLKMTVIRFFTLCPGTYPQQIYSFGVLSFYPPSSASATSGKLLLKHATSIKQYVSFSNHSTIYFYCQSNSSKKSILLTDTSYATLFSVCVSDNFLTYSRLWILPQICTCPPTSKPEANLAFRPQQMHGM